jgi:hypothetical protein
MRDALVACARDIGVTVPSAGRYERWRASSPSFAGAPTLGRFRRRFGSWSKALSSLLGEPETDPTVNRLLAHHPGFSSREHCGRSAHSTRVWPRMSFRRLVRTRSGPPPRRGIATEGPGSRRPATRLIATLGPGPQRCSRLASTPSRPGEDDLRARSASRETTPDGRFYERGRRLGGRSSFKRATTGGSATATAAELTAPRMTHCPHRRLQSSRGASAAGAPHSRRRWGWTPCRRGAPVRPTTPTRS